MATLDQRPQVLSRCRERFIEDAIAKWKPEEFLDCLNVEKREELANFLEVETEEINRSQRIILVAEAYDFSVLVGAEWLNEQFGVDILCCRLALARDGNTEFMVCSNVFPAPELVQQAVRRGGSRTGIHPSKWPDWDTALKNVTNDALITYYRGELAAGRENYLRKRILRYRIANKRRWFVAARRDRAYVWQNGRFNGDIEFWRNGLTQADQVKPVKVERCLSFLLTTEADFRFFNAAATTKLANANWVEYPGDETEADGQEDA